MLIAIVVGGIVRTRDGDGSGNRGDFLPTVGHDKGNLIEVVVRVGKLVQCTISSTLQTHVRLTSSILTFHHVGTGGRGRAAEGKVVIHVVQRSIGRGGIARHGVLNAVIRFRIRLTNNSHRHINRVDLLVTVYHNKVHLIEVRVRVGELCGSETHVGSAGILAGGRDDTFHEGGTACRCEDEVDVVTRHLVQVGA